MSKPLIIPTKELVAANHAKRLSALERTAMTRMLNSGVFSAVPAGATVVPNAWTNICSIAVDIPVPMTVRFHAWAGWASTAAGQPSVAIGIFDGDPTAGGIQIDGTVAMDLQGSTVATQPILNGHQYLGTERFGEIGQHTYYLAAWKSASGAATVAKSQVQGAYTTAVTKLMVALS